MVLRPLLGRFRSTHMQCSRQPPRLRRLRQCNVMGSGSEASGQESAPSAGEGTPMALGLSVSPRIASYEN